MRWMHCIDIVLCVLGMWGC